MAEKVRVLEESVARKIAAGEVIDRPHSIVRELMDNAVDAGAARIELSLEGGGIDCIRLTDNGRGMSFEDLKLCCLPHATSKIQQEDDLMRLTSLGFRGEALSSIAASSRLEIISTKGGESYKLSIPDGRLTEPLPWRGREGTIVETRDLFYSIPARRKFLKRPASEGTLCRRTFLEKALPFPDIHFQLSSEGKLHTLLPPASLKERVCTAWGSPCPPALMEERKVEIEGASITIIAGRPELNRNDRRYLQIYANKRRIDEYAFIQAMQYGYDEILPGGVFPVCFAFLDVDPQLVDFNIHPAKREARFRNNPELHHALVLLIKNFLKEFQPVFPGKDVKKEAATGKAHQGYLEGMNQGTSSGNKKESPPGEHAFPRALSRTSYPATPAAQLQRFGDLVRETPPLRRELSPAPCTKEAQPVPGGREPQESPEEEIRYMGQIMGVFLLAEKGDSLFIVDQHAAHERLLFNRYRSEEPVRQDLLIPYSFEATKEEILFMEAQRPVFEGLGINFAPSPRGLVEITALPLAALSLEKEIEAFLKCRKGSPAELQKDLYATMSCRNAIKEGDPIDPEAALELLKGALSLDNPRCPHGRLLWFRLSREELYGLVGRLV